MLLGIQRIEKKGAIISEKFPHLVINLINQTTQAEVFSILSHVDLIVTEDSGLGHLAWIQGVKTLFLFGSTRADWTAPPYQHVVNLTSSDLECGDCMQAICRHGDVRCLTRYTPDFVLTKINQLIEL